MSIEAYRVVRHTHDGRHVRPLSAEVFFSKGDAERGKQDSEAFWSDAK